MTKRKRLKEINRKKKADEYFKIKRELLRTLDLEQMLKLHAYCDICRSISNGEFELRPEEINNMIQEDLKFMKELKEWKGNNGLMKL